MKISYFLLVSSLLLAVSCKPKPAEEEAASSTETTHFVLEKSWETDTLFRTPESVLFSAAQDILFVSNVNGVPDAKDGNGFISTLGTDGEIIDLEWVTGLNAPKGMAIYHDMLYVSDIDELVIINIDEASVFKRIKVPGAMFLNDVAVDKNGRVYFSDSGTGKVHLYENGKVSDWITEGLKRPNGLYVEGTRILLASSESSDLKEIDPATGKFKVLAGGIGHGDGVEYTGYEGYYLVSDWAGEVFLIHPDFSRESLLKTKDQKVNSADIGLDPENHVVYVPTFFDNRVVAYNLVMHQH